MTTKTFAPRIQQMVEARARLDRRAIARIIREDLEQGPQSGEFWREIGQFAAQIGENALSREAARRFAATNPADVDHVFYYAMVLARDVMLTEALALMEGLPVSGREHPAILNLRANLETQLGNFDKAEALLRKAIAISPAPVQWLSLSVAKKFTSGDPDIATMEAVLPRVGRAPPPILAQLYYALGKAYDDVKDMPKAVEAYAMGAALMRNVAGPAKGSAWLKFVTHLIDGYTAENMAKLKPSAVDAGRMLFVSGFPRSGTTLVEQILTSHSQVCAGSELNLVPVALIPASHIEALGGQKWMTPSVAEDYLETGDYTFADAIAYQERHGGADPWGDIGRDYLAMAEDRFGPNGFAVDKTLNLGSFMGLLLHSLPNAKVFWLRRKPEDCALSNYRLYSQPGTLPWTYSPTDIAEFFKAEDLLYRHWTKMFPDRIMTVPYEELVSDPQTWIRKILAHAGLPEEPQVFEPHKSKRAVATASMAQVRSPISTARIGASEAYAAFTDEFRKAYYGG